MSNNSGGGFGFSAKSGDGFGSGTYAEAARMIKNKDVGGFARLVANKVGTRLMRREMTRFAHDHHMSLFELDALMFGVSEIGKVVVGTRYGTNFEDTGKAGISGWFTHGEKWNNKGLIKGMAANILGLPFDLNDTLLGYQGIPTASAVDAIMAGQKTLVGHSLGALDVANLQSMGFVKSSKLYALPFPYISPGGSSVALEYDDPIGGLFFGKFTNLNASVCMPSGTAVPHVYAGIASCGSGN